MYGSVIVSVSGCLARRLSARRRLSIGGIE